LYLFLACCQHSLVYLASLVIRGGIDRNLG